MDKIGLQNTKHHKKTFLQGSGSEIYSLIFCFIKQSYQAGVAPRNHSPKKIGVKNKGISD